MAEPIGTLLSLELTWDLEFRIWSFAARILDTGIYATAPPPRHCKPHAYAIEYIGLFEEGSHSGLVRAPAKRLP